MNRIAICVCMTVWVGCAPEPVPHAVDRGGDAEVDDGGTIENADRERAEAYFIALGNVQSVEEEEQLLTEFGAWLEEKGYVVSVEVQNGNHNLSCPCFPPDTPWTSHSFFDIRNLELLPRLDNGG